MSRAWLARHAWSVAASVVVLAVLAASLWAMPRHVFWSPDEGGKFFELSSIHWDGGPALAVPYVGRRLDAELRFFPRGPSQPHTAFPYPVTTGEGGVRFQWPLWFPLASRPLFEAFGITGIYLIPLLSGWLIALTSGRIAYALAPHLAPATILVVGLATPVWFYSLTFWEHTPAVCLGLLAVACVLTGRTAVGAATAPRAAWRVGLVPIGLLFAAALLRLDMAAFGAAAILTWAMVGHPPRAGTADPESELRASARRGRRAWVAAPIAAVLAAALWLAAASSPAPRQARFFSSLPRQIGASFHRASVLPHGAASIFVNSANDEGPVAPPASVAAVTLALVLCGIAPFIRRAWVEACVVVPALLAVLAFSALLLGSGQGYRSLHGFFPIAPFTVFGFYAVAHARRGDWRRRALASFAMCYLAIGYAMLFVYRIDGRGGFMSGLEWGSRYLLALYPVLAILAIAGLDAYARSSRPPWLRVVVASLIACMVAVALQLQMRGVSMLRTNRELFASWDRALQSEQPIVTDVWWLPTALAPLFVAKETYCVRGPAELLEWQRMAAARGVTAFTFATLVPPLDDAMGPALRRVAERSDVVSGLHVVRYELRQAGRETSQ